MFIWLPYKTPGLSGCQYNTPLPEVHKESLANEIVRKMVIKPLTVSGKRHAKSSLFAVAFDQPRSNSEAF